MFCTEFLDIPPLTGAAGSVRLPGSKSISNRVLLLAALASGRTVLHDLLDSDDTQVMLAALRELGCGVTQQGATMVVDGLAGQLPQRQARLFMGNAGTAIRPLTAALALLGGEFELSGVPRMHERPIGDLVDALRNLGCQIGYLGEPGFPPLQLHPPGTLQLQAPIRVRGDVSSQFLTALLMALPLVAKEAITVEVVGELISKPYVAITLNLLARFGITVAQLPAGAGHGQRFVIPAGAAYRSPGEFWVEADASSASYFIALGAINTLARSQNGIKIEGLGLDSIQGDIRFVEAARQMGAQVEGGPGWLHVHPGAWPLHPVNLDCNHIPDAAMTLAVLALYADGPSTLRNIASWRVKETDRIAAMACELRKLGAQVEEGTDFLRITPPASPTHWRAARVRTYDDHRMAMCFSLAAFNPAGLPVRIEDPKCVGKTFPDYFEALFSVAQCDAVPVICIDGPTASGKGTLAAALAQRLGYAHLDSGALYRVTALVALRAGLALTSADEAAIAALVGRLALRFDGGQVWLGQASAGEHLRADTSENITDAIRTEAAGMHASAVSALPAVRTALLAMQHRFARLPGLVADGRDMGTVIFPHAPLKVYLTASAEQRAQRRHKQLIAKGIASILADLCADLAARDERDSTRAAAPLKSAQDALLLDNTNLTVEESIRQVLSWWQSKQPFKHAASPLIE
ncbi:MAG: bifunctional 3-phosphoshikimate 1-carboxyvinyltransferase/cytidylate kinase [Burkholderiaceae bacterium]